MAGNNVTVTRAPSLVDELERIRHRISERAYELSRTKDGSSTPDEDWLNAERELQDGMLCLRGERRQEKEEKGKKFHRIERAYGQFERRLALPSEVDAQKVAAEFKDGVLKVHLPKSASAKPKAIEVKVS